jgi:hypothetical protein
MPLPIWITGAEVRSSVDDWRGTVVQQFGKTVVCLLHDAEPDDYLSTHRAFHALDLLPVIDPISDVLDRRQVVPEPWCRQRPRTLSLGLPQRIVCRTLGARARTPLPPAEDRPTPLPARPRPTWA